ncbi:MAG: ATP-dependent RNA helicase HrpA [Pseudomonadota bacterium]
MTDPTTQPPSAEDLDLQQLKDAAAFEWAVEQAMGRDQAALRRRFAGIEKRRRNGLPVDRGEAQLCQALAASAQARKQREQTPLKLTFDPDLPISGHVDAIAEAMKTHQVLVVAGETGSGKTTQLPKACWLAGRGRDGWIGCTQPRRIAARSISARLAEELEAEVGREVGYQVRFDQRVTGDSLFKIMTDGVLLSETERDRDLRQYDTLIIDEAHERSLNIDFLLGYLKRLLPRRPDLRVLITSATIDTERFSAHFDNAPVISVSGRTYPVEVRYRPLIDESGTTRDVSQAIVEAVTELDRVDRRGDALVFLPGERDIREAGEALNRAGLRNTEVLPLYARLSRNEQQKIFRPGPARRIVLATNVAETSLTVPRIRYVIDSGLARISRYSQRSKVQRLPIEPVSQASANQRAGRCGRLGPGICVRLYDEDDFAGRPAYTEPEILRTNLASVILQMALLRLGQVEDYPFLDPPAPAFVRDGYQLLRELKAMTADQRLTRLGRDMARWPLDVRLARLVLAGQEQDCLAPAMVLAAFLSLQDPRERPLDAQQAADEKQAIWQDPESDLAGVLRLWADWQATRKSESNRGQRNWCREHFLSYLRMREWSDLVRQLSDLAREQMKKAPEPLVEVPEKAAPLHRAFLSAFLGHVGVKDEKSYLGARDRRYQIFPGSGLFKKGPRWMVSGFLVETQRLYARMNAAVEPGWIEAAADHLVQRRYFDPQWSPRSGRVLGYEQVSLFGLVLVGRRKVHYGPHDPAGAREIFLREALATNQLQTRGKFLAHNRQVLKEADLRERQQRRRDLVIDPETLAAWFAQRVPEDIYTTKAFEKWRVEEEKTEPRRLWLAPEDVFTHAGRHPAGGFPQALTAGGTNLPLSYTFEPGTEDDGVTLELPLALVNLPKPERLEWLVPGYLENKVVALIKSLPKPIRRRVVPVPDHAAAFLNSAQADPASGAGLLESLADFLAGETGQPLSPDDFDPAVLEPWLKMNVRLWDGDRQMAQSRSLTAIQGEWAEQGRRQFLKLSEESLRRDGAVAWDFGPLPPTTELDGGITACPALVDQGDAVGVRVFDDAAEAQDHHRYGLRRLLELTLSDKFRYLSRQLKLPVQTRLQYAGLGSGEDLQADLVFAVSMALVDSAPAPPRDPDTFAELVARVRTQVVPFGTELTDLVAQVLDQHHAVSRLLDEELEKRSGAAVADIRQQLEYLVYPGFLTEVPRSRLADYPRYLEAAKIRIERLAENPVRDRERHEQMRGFWEAYVARCEAQAEYPADLDAFHWLLEEYRVSLFAQPLKTALPVSGKRLKTAWNQL